MKTYIREIVASTAIFALVASLSFVGLEAPSSEAASTEDQFTATQNITSEIAFTQGALDLNMVPITGGLTGGTSTAETHVRVLTNNLEGYNMTIKASSTPAMQGMTQTNDIDDYTPVNPDAPDFQYNVPSGFEFAYSVSASTTADLHQKFKDDGSSICGSGGTLDTIFPNNGGLASATSSSCWYKLMTSSTSTINRSTQTPNSGATTTIYFRLTVNPNSNPTEDDYRATTTFTATTN